MEHKCIIGVWFDYEDASLVTNGDLKDLVAIRNKGVLSGTIRAPYISPLSDYYDRRRSTELQHFDYCPYCGRKIDWAKLRKEAKD